jgi:hypothetical protein
MSSPLPTQVPCCHVPCAPADSPGTAALRADQIAIPETDLHDLDPSARLGIRSPPPF